MGSSSKKAVAEQRLAQLLDTCPQGIVIGEALATDLRARLEIAISDKMWRDLLRGCGCDLAPLVEGVRQEDFHHLERTLLALWQQWRESDPQTKRALRRAVIQAKDHAKWVARSPKVDADKRAVKEEMVLWMLIWLENPDAFEPWVALRKRRLSTVAPTAATPSTAPE